MRANKGAIESNFGLLELVTVENSGGGGAPDIFYPLNEVELIFCEQRLWIFPYEKDTVSANGSFSVK